MGDEDKQFDATPRKLEQARKEGQVVKSKDFSTALSLLILFSVIFGLAPFVWDQIVQLYTLLYEQIPNGHLSEIGMTYNKMCCFNYWTNSFYSLVRCDYG